MNLDNIKNIIQNFKDPINVELERQEKSKLLKYRLFRAVVNNQSEEVDKLFKEKINYDEIYWVDGEHLNLLDISIKKHLPDVTQTILNNSSSENIKSFFNEKTLTYFNDFDSLKQFFEHSRVYELKKSYSPEIIMKKMIDFGNKKPDLWVDMINFYTQPTQSHHKSIINNKLDEIFSLVFENGNLEICTKFFEDIHSLEKNKAIEKVLLNYLQKSNKPKYKNETNFNIFKNSLYIFCKIKPDLYFEKEHYFNNQATFPSNSKFSKYPLLFICKFLDNQYIFDLLKEEPDFKESYEQFIIKNPSVISFLNHKIISNLREIDKFMDFSSYKDASGNNILHVLSQEISGFELAKKVLNFFLEIHPVLFETPNQLGLLPIDVSKILGGSKTFYQEFQNKASIINENTALKSIATQTNSKKIGIL